MQEQMKMNINLSDTTPMKCTKCESDTFQIAFLLKKVPAPISPTGEETIMPVQIFECNECGERVLESIPKDD